MRTLKTPLLKKRGSLKQHHPGTTIELDLRRHSRALQLRHHRRRPSRRPLRSCPARHRLARRSPRRRRARRPASLAATHPHPRLARRMAALPRSAARSSANISAPSHGTTAPNASSTAPICFRIPPCAPLFAPSSPATSRRPPRGKNSNRPPASSPTSPAGRYGTVFAAFPDGHNTLYDFALQLWSRGGELTDCRPAAPSSPLPKRIQLSNSIAASFAIQRSAIPALRNLTPPNPATFSSPAKSP